MHKPTMILAAIAYTISLAAPAGADDVTGANQMLCTAVTASECFADGLCMPGEPEDWNIPRFLELDFEKQVLRTTKASGEARSTPMKNIEDEGDRIFIQGTQQGRAFSIVLDQDSGTASVGVALEGHVLAIFAYCTPMDFAD